MLAAAATAARDLGLEEGWRGGAEAPSSDGGAAADASTTGSGGGGGCGASSKKSAESLAAARLLLDALEAVRPPALVRVLSPRGLCRAWLGALLVAASAGVGVLRGLAAPPPPSSSSSSSSSFSSTSTEEAPPLSLHVHIAGVLGRLADERAAIDVCYRAVQERIGGAAAPPGASPVASSSSPASSSFSSSSSSNTPTGASSSARKAKELAGKSSASAAAASSSPARKALPKKGTSVLVRSPEMLRAVSEVLGGLASVKERRMALFAPLDDPCLDDDTDENEVEVYQNLQKRRRPRGTNTMPLP